MNKTLCAPGLRRKEQCPHKRLSQTCLWVSRSLQWRCGLTVACHRVRGTDYKNPESRGVLFWRRLPLPLLKDDAVKVLHSVSQQVWKTLQWPQDWKKSVFIPIPKKCNAKEWSNYHTIALISHASKVMLKILQARLQQYMNQELPDVQDEFRKGRGTRIKLPTSVGS